MACTHPDFMLDEVVHPEDGRLGLHCSGCGMVAYAGDSLLRSLWDDIWRRIKR